MQWDLEFPVFGLLAKKEMGLREPWNGNLVPTLISQAAGAVFKLE